MSNREFFAPRRWRLLLVVVCTAAVTACNSGGSNEDADDSGGGGTGGGGSTSSRGDLLQNPPALVTTLAASSLLADPGDPLQQALLLQAGSPTCDIKLHRIEYKTVGGAGEETTASGALMVPTGTAAKCSGTRPIVLYAHGTNTDKAFDLTNLQSSGDNPEGYFLAAFFAAQGYIVVAPNYAGYAGSQLAYHPYLNAEQQSSDMIDALRAARTALPTADAPNTAEADQLYVTGYSQGGYVALATQRALEAAGKRVDAVVPMSGPYALAAFGDAVFAGRVNAGATISTTMLLTSYQRSYGGIYGAATDVYSDQYAAGIESLFPSTVNRSQLYADGALPRDALFSLTPPAPEYADITPATTPAALAQLFERGFGDAPLIRNSYRLSYLQDMAANPDGYWPDKTTSEPPASPALEFRRALKRNDLRTFSPTTPTLLCGGHEDPVVYWLNTEAMQSYWAAKAPAAAPFSVLDVDAATTSNDTYESIKRRFAVAKDLIRAAAVVQGASDGGDEAVLDAYHAGLVAPFCMEAARDFFERN